MSLMTTSFEFSGSEVANRKVTFSDVQRVHNDNELMVFSVTIEAENLTASCSAESLQGDHGFLVDPLAIASRSLGEPTQLSQLMKQLGSGPVWDGQQTWRCLGGELQVRFEVDDLGHVDVCFEICPAPWRQPWSAIYLLQYDLGDLTSTGSELADWFTENL